jgi:hypothetical protein
MQITNKWIGRPAPHVRRALSLALQRKSFLTARRSDAAARQLSQMTVGRKHEMRDPAVPSGLGRRHSGGGGARSC